MYLFLFQNTQSQLSQVKDRVMKYLGSLGGSLNHELLANTNEEISKQAITWDCHQHLKFDMPFVDMKPTIYFGIKYLFILILINVITYSFHL